MYQILHRAPEHSARPRILAVIVCLCLAGPVTAQTLYQQSFTSGLGDMIPILVCGTGGGWFPEDSCAASPSAPTPPSHGAWHCAPDDCDLYSTSQHRAVLETPWVDVSACAAETETRVELTYLLDFEEGYTYDRAIVEVVVDGATQTLATNEDLLGAVDPTCGSPLPEPIGNLRNDASWHRVAFSVASGSSLKLRLISDTYDEVSNAGQGFLVDEVKVSCVNETIFADGFESGTTAQWSAFS